MICAESCHEATAGRIYEPGAQRSTGVVCKPVDFSKIFENSGERRDTFHV